METKNNGEGVKIQKITVRMLEAYFSGIQILLDYMNSLDNPTSRRVVKKFMQEVKVEGNSLDQSEAIYGYLIYLLRNPWILSQVNEKQRTEDLSVMALKFIKLNGLAPPSPGYVNRVHIPEEMDKPSVIIKPN